MALIIFQVPLFGLHFILSPYVMCDSAPMSQFYNFFNRLIEGIQGLIVAMMYCFFNGEVTNLLKKTLLSIKFFKWTKKNNSNFETIEFDLENVGFLENSFVRIKRSIFRKSSTNSELRITNNDLNNINLKNLTKNDVQI